jgi:hypothetical protein
MRETHNTLPQEVEMKSDRSIWIVLCILLVIALVGMGMVFYQTRFGPNAGGDSVRYIMTAANLQSGHGYARTSGGGEYIPETGFPPFFSVVLAVLGIASSDLYAVSRWMNAILFGVNIFLVGFLIYRNTTSPWPSLIGASLVMVARYQVVIHSSVMSEGLFILLMLLILYGLSWYLDTYRYPVLITTAILVAFATLTRYVGFALLATGATGLLLLSSTSWKRRAGDIFIYCSLSFLPVLLWLRRNSSIGGSMTNRQWIYHPMRPEVLQGYITVVANWVVPPIFVFTYRLRLFIVAVTGLLGPGIYLFRQIKSTWKTRELDRRVFFSLPWLLMMFMAAYLGILFINSTFLDAATTSGAPIRYLSPLYVTFIVLIVLTIYWNVVESRISKIIGILTVLLAVFVVIFKAQPTLVLLRDPEPKLGYRGFGVSFPYLLDALEDIDPSRPLMTNNPELLYALIERPAYMWPIYYDAYQQTYNEDFDKAVDSARELMKSGGVLVVFGKPEDYEMRVVDMLEIKPLTITDVAIIYSHPDVLSE